MMLRATDRTPLVREAILQMVKQVAGGQCRVALRQATAHQP